MASDDPNGQQKSIRNLLGTWAENTGMHGLPNITRTTNKPKKITWALLLLTGLGVLVYQITTIIMTYYSYPITIQRENILYLPTDFPAVTVCNRNAARRTQISKSFESTSSSSTGNSTTSTNSTSSNSSATSAAGSGGATAAGSGGATAAGSGGATAAGSGASPTGAPASPGRRKKRSLGNEGDKAASGDKGKDYSHPSKDQYNGMLDSKYSDGQSRNLSALPPGTIPDSLASVYTFLDYYNTLTNQWKIDVGYPISDFLIECSFGSEYCNAKNFSRFLHPLYGNCYTFNAYVNGTTSASVMEPGPLHGLTLTLWVDQTEYVGTVSPAAGVRLVIHERNKMPFPEESGVNLATGMETIVGMKRRYVKSLVSPYNDDCQGDWAKANQVTNLYATTSNFSLPNVNYSQTACRKTCVQKKVEEECECSSPNLPISNPTVDSAYSTTYSICQYGYNSTAGTLSDQAKCMQSVEKSAFKTCKQVCKQDCESYYFDTSISVLTWPSNEYEKDATRFVSMYNENVRKKVTETKEMERATFVSQNFVKVTIYYEDAVTHEVISTAGYTLTDLLSDMGGQVGLWLGLSVLTLFEIVEIFVDLFVLTYKSKHRPTKPKDAWLWTASKALNNPSKISAISDAPPPPMLNAFEKEKKVAL